MGKKVNFCDEEVSASCIINTLVSELRGKKKEDKVTHQPVLAPETQTVKKDTLSAQHASIFLLPFLWHQCFQSAITGITGCKGLQKQF